MDKANYAAVETDNLGKMYNGISRVTGVNLMVPQGTIYGFLGPNGAGKSTTLKMLLGLARPSTGKIKVLNQPLTSKNKIAILKNIGSLIESPSYYGHLTGLENLKIVAALKGVQNNDIHKVLEIVRLENHQNKKVAEYSLGMKQRLGIAIALLGTPKLLILDEPTNGLDPTGIQEIRMLIKSIPIKYGITVIISSHLLSEIDQVADHIGIINQGKIIFQGPTQDLHAQATQHIAIRTLNNEMAHKILLSNDYRCELNDVGYLLLPKLKDQELANCTRLLCKHELGIVRVEDKSKSLEDIFLELIGTGKSL